MTMRPSSYNRRGQWGDPAHASSVVKVLTEAGQANSPGRNMKRMLQLRYTTHLTWIGGTSGCRASFRGADVAMVSDEPTGQLNRLGSEGPLDSWSGSEVPGAAWTQVRLRLQ